MSEERERQLKTAVYTAVVVTELVVMLWIMVPSFRFRVQRGLEWVRWYSWRARWASMPPYLREAMEVRGVQPPG